MVGRINFKFRTLETVAKAVQSANRVQKAAPLSTDQKALAAKAIEKFGGGEKFDAMVAAAAQKGAKKAYSIDRASTGSAPTARTGLLAANTSAREQAALLKGTPNGPITSATGAALRNDKTSRYDPNGSEQRIAIDADVAEATGNLAISRKSGTLSREEIAAQERAIGCGNGATDAASVLAIMRANRARGRS
jgi:hypothetical protein